MGWANCGIDSNGRPIGYAHPATCDHPGCKVKIDRGLAYACGGMHGTEAIGGDDRIDWSADFPSCEKYFCEKHLIGAVFETDEGAELWTPSYCVACTGALEAARVDDPDMRDMIDAALDTRQQGTALSNADRADGEG